MQNTSTNNKGGGQGLTMLIIWVPEICSLAYK